MSATATVIRFLWRFFISGRHLNGKKYNDSTWHQKASPRYRHRRESYTWWRRKAGWQRAAWRNSFFWTATAFICGFVWSISSMLLILASLVPFIGYVLFKRGRLALYDPVVAHNNDGSVVQLWLPKTNTRHALEMMHLRKREGRKRPGLARPEELVPQIRVEDIPLEYANAVRAEVTELGGQPPIELKLLMDPGGDS